MLYANTVSQHPTHFLRAVELIIKAREEHQIPSENWPYPTGKRFGIPNDRYYAEIWVDGMDWQATYWIVEEKELDKPRVYPFIIFGDHAVKQKFNEWDFKELISASLWFRRDKYFIKQDDLGHFTDTVWPFLHMIKDTYQPDLFEVYFKHASQQRIDFIMNYRFIPKFVFGRKPNEDNRGNRNTQTGYVNSI